MRATTRKGSRAEPEHRYSNDMLGRAKVIYLATRKRNDQLFDKYFMRPLAAGVVAIVDCTPVMPDQCPRTRG